MTAAYPRLETKRLVLRGLTADDAGAIQRLAGRAEVAATTVRIPHPYPDGAAVEWIATHAPRFESGRGIVMGVVADGDLVGSVGLEIEPSSRRGELGYWIGVPYWGCGYATEAAGAVLEYGFGTLELHRIYAHCFASNPASARVLEKIGLRPEGTLPEHLLKDGQYEDLLLFGLLRRQFVATTGGSGA